MKHLYKIGLRRCCSCKRIKRIEEFATNKDHCLQKDYRCKPCFEDRKIRFLNQRQIKRNRTTLELRFQVLLRDDFTCQYCGRKAPEVRLQVDHIMPVIAKGESIEQNLTTACEECNWGKSDFILKNKNSRKK